MTNNNEENSEVKQNTSIEANKAPETSITKNSLNKNLIISGIAFTLAVVAIIIAAYILQLNIQLQRKQADERMDLSTQITQLKETVTKSQEQIDAKTLSTEQSQNTLQNELDNIKKQLQTSISQRLYHSQDWQLLKARYYLELAQINSHWSDNFKTTIALLQSADDLLKQITEPKIFNIRQAIAKEITQIKSISIIDVAGLLSQLDAAQMSVSNLNFQSTKDADKKNAKGRAADASNPSAWKLRLQDSVHLLEQLVVIRRDNEDIKPLMSPLFESALRESIQLNLQQAQWAILNNNPTVYQLALKQALLSLKRVSNEKDKNTLELLRQLNSLQQVKLTQEKPVIGQGLPLLNQIIESRETLIQPANSAKGEGPQ